jgi:hypothetical protein
MSRMGKKANDQIGAEDKAQKYLLLRQVDIYRRNAYAQGKVAQAQAYQYAYMVVVHNTQADSIRIISHAVIHDRYGATQAPIAGLSGHPAYIQALEIVLQKVLLKSM